MDRDDDMDTGTPIAKRSGIDLIFGIAVLAMAVLFTVWAIPASIRVPDSVKAAPLSPAFLPYTLTALIGAMGVVCIFQATLGQGVPKEASELTFTARSGWPARLATVLTSFVAIWLLPEIIGMLPTAIFVMGALVFIGGERNLLRGLLVSVVVPFGVWLFFTQVAQVPLPEGLLEGYLSI